MKVPDCIRQNAATRLVLLIALIAGAVAPGHARDRLLSAAATPVLTASGSWIPTGNLVTPRVWHSATLLANGQVLVVGGYGLDPYQTGVLDSTELYDPTRGEWSTAGRLNLPRGSHTATLLPDGKVLVVGGHCCRDETAEVYDPKRDTWSLASAPQRDAPPGHGGDHTATLLQTGKVLVVGGGGYYPYGFGSVAALYDPATDTWSRTGSLAALHGVGHRATLLQDGRVLVTGGSPPDPDISFGTPDTELYDPVTGIWTHGPNLLVPRFAHSATLLPDGKVLVAGGDSLQSYPDDPYRTGVVSPPNNTAELFDPATGKWSSAGTLNTGHSDHTASLLPGGDILVAGGYTYHSPGSDGVTNGAERYVPGDALWRNTGSLGVPRYGHTATLLPNGKVLVAGGSYDRPNSAELYDPITVPGTIGPGFTGAWFDTAQSGHGLFLEVLPDNRFLAWWFTFNPAGTERAWFGGVGAYSGNTATIADVYQTTGGRWIPNFDPSRIVNNRWGTFTFTFADCSHGTIDFDSVRGYGAGRMNLTRLTQPAGLRCP